MSSIPALMLELSFLLLTPGLVGERHCSEDVEKGMMDQEMTVACLFQRVLMVLMDTNKVHNHKILEVVEVNCLLELKLVSTQSNLMILVEGFLILDQILHHQELE